MIWTLVVLFICYICFLSVRLKNIRLKNNKKEFIETLAGLAILRSCWGSSYCWGITCFIECCLLILKLNTLISKQNKPDYWVQHADYFEFLCNIKTEIYFSVLFVPREKIPFVTRSKSVFRTGKSVCCLNFSSYAKVCLFYCGIQWKRNGAQSSSKTKKCG